MNTILPKFINFNSNNAFYNSSNWKPAPDPIYMIIFVILVIVGIIIGIIGWRRYTKAKSQDIKDDISTNLWGIEIAIVFASICLLICYVGDNVNNSSIKDDYTSGGFKIAQTNLMASPYKILSKEDHKTLKPNKNYHKSDYYVYVDLINAKPTGIDSDYVINQMSIVHDRLNSYTYAENDDDKSIILLGHMKNGTFIPNYKNKKIVHTFMNYVNYIKKHKLESKFKHHFSFEVSDVYFTKDHEPVLVMIGDNKLTLHYKNNKAVKDTDIVQSN